MASIHQSHCGKWKLEKLLDELIWYNTDDVLRRCFSDRRGWKAEESLERERVKMKED